MAKIKIFLGKQTSVLASEKCIAEIIMKGYTFKRRWNLDVRNWGYEKIENKRTKPT